MPAVRPGEHQVVAFPGLGGGAAFGLAPAVIAEDRHQLRAERHRALAPFGLGLPDVDLAAVGFGDVPLDPGRTSVEIEVGPAQRQEFTSVKTPPGGDLERWG